MVLMIQTLFLKKHFGAEAGALVLGLGKVYFEIKQQFSNLPPFFIPHGYGEL